MRAAIALPRGAGPEVEKHVRRVAKDILQCADPDETHKLARSEHVDRFDHDFVLRAWNNELPKPEKKRHCTDVPDSNHRSERAREQYISGNRERLQQRARRKCVRDVKFADLWQNLGKEEWSKLSRAQKQPWFDKALELRVREQDTKTGRFKSVWSTKREDVEGADLAAQANKGMKEYEIETPKKKQPWRVEPIGGLCFNTDIGN